MGEKEKVELHNSLHVPCKYYKHFSSFLSISLILNYHTKTRSLIPTVVNDNYTAYTKLKHMSKGHTTQTQIDTHANLHVQN